METTIEEQKNEEEIETAVEETTVEVVEKKKKTRVAGIIYLSSIPTKMNVKLIRDYFSDFGVVDRIFLQPEDKKHNRGVRMFSEGWVEFKDKKHAKSAAIKLNRQLVGGKRKNPWYEEMWNIKYLKNFRWTHLNERLAYENESRKQRLRQEVMLAKKEANFYIRNYQKGEKQKRLEKKKLKQENGGEGGGENKTVENNATFINTNQNVEDNNSDTEDKYSSKRPKFERKIKVANNDSFLKQVFS